LQLIGLTYQLETEIEQGRIDLEALNEPDFSIEEEGLAAVRFTHSAGIRGQGVSITLIRDADSCYLRAKYLQAFVSDTTGGMKSYDWRLDSMSHVIRTAQMNEVFNKLDDCFFWDINGDITARAGFDGYSWYLEAAAWDHDLYQYHQVGRWVPYKGSFYEACMYIIQLSDPEVGLDVNKIISGR
ncbi:MAG: hypothetical protein AAFV07_08755, partial [Bacteroidota bacterium]